MRPPLSDKIPQPTWRRRCTPPGSRSRATLTLAGQRLTAAARSGSSTRAAPRSRFTRAATSVRSGQPGEPPVNITTRPSSGRALPADQLTAAGLSELASVVHKKAARAGELRRLPGDHLERKVLV